MKFNALDEVDDRGGGEVMVVVDVEAVRPDWAGTGGRRCPQPRRVLEGEVAEIALLVEKRCLTWSLVVAAMCEWCGLKRLRAEAVMPHWKAEPMMTDQK